MNPIINPQSYAPCCPGAFTDGRSLQVETTRAGSLSLNQQAAVSIATREGDTVTINLASLTTADAGIQRSVVNEDGTRSTTQTAFLSLSDSRSLDISVTGDLNAREKEEILAALTAIGGMIEDFLSGDPAAAGEDAQGIGELETIASLDVAFSVERQVVYAEQERVTISDAALSNQGDHVRPRGHGRGRRLMQRIDRLTNDMTDTVARFGGRKRQLANAVQSMLGRYRDAGRDNNTFAPLRTDALATVQTVFTQKIDALFESSDFSFSYSA